MYNQLTTAPTPKSVSRLDIVCSQRSLQNVNIPVLLIKNNMEVKNNLNVSKSYIINLIVHALKAEKLIWS